MTRVLRSWGAQEGAPGSRETSGRLSPAWLSTAMPWKGSMVGGWSILPMVPEGLQARLQG